MDVFKYCATILDLTMKVTTHFYLVILSILYVAFVIPPVIKFCPIVYVRILYTKLVGVCCVQFLSII